MGAVASLMATLGLDAAPFRRAWTQSKSDITKMGGDIKSGIGDAFKQSLPFTNISGAVMALGDAAKKAVEFGGRMTDLSKRLGISTDAIQEWDLALKLNGSTIESAAGFFEKLAVARQKALAGSDKEIESFKKLGVSMDDLKNKRVEDIAGQIAQKFASGGDPQKLIASLRDVGGKGAGDMIASFSDLKDIMGQVPIASAADIAILDEAGDKWTKLTQKLEVFGAQIFSSVIHVTDVLTQATSVATNTILNLVVGFISGFAGTIQEAAKNVFKGDLSLLTKPLGVLGKAFGAGSQEAGGTLSVYLDKLVSEENAARNKGGKKFTPLGDEEITNKDAEKTAAEILRIKRETQRVEIETALAAMTAGQRAKALAEGIAALKSDIAKTPEGKERAEMERELARMEQKQGAAERQAEREDESDDKKKRAKMAKSEHKTELTEAQKLGAYVNPATLGQMDVAAKSEQHLGRILAELKEHRQLLGKTKF